MILSCNIAPSPLIKCSEDKSFAFKKKGGHTTKVRIPNRANLIQQINIEISYAPTDHVIVPDTVKITFNLDIESTDKTRSIIKYVCRALAKTERKLIQ